MCFYYNNHRNPRLLLRPAKIEIANLKPRVWMLRNVLMDSEMDRLKELAGPKVCVNHFLELLVAVVFLLCIVIVGMCVV